MDKKKFGSKKIITWIIILIFGGTSVLGAALSYFGNKATAETSKGISESTKTTQSNEQAPVQQPSNANAISKYITFSENGNIEIIVNYMSPVNKDQDNLTFEVLLDTHSVDLSKYVDIRKYVELRTDAGITIKDGFEWNLENKEAHHISGILKVKNNIDGKPVVGSDTKSFKLVFKNIGETGEREHVYQGDSLK
jgi:flagellar basal body-associated protein FliL